jgi:hypothetical protein
MLAASENNRISDSDPQEYISQLWAEHDANAAVIFASNLVPKTTEFDYKKGTFGAVLEARSRLIAEFIAGLCDGKGHQRSRPVLGAV